MTEIGTLCPAHRPAQGSKDSNGIGDACSETDMSGQKDMRNRCPIAQFTDANCKLIPGKTLPPAILDRWHGPMEERRRASANRQG